MELKSPIRLTKVLSVLLSMLAIISVLAMLADLYQICTHPSSYGNTDPNAPLSLCELIGGIIRLLQLVLLIPTGITFLCWIYRSSAYFGQVSRGKMTFTPGWSVGWYFIPFANLYKPYEVMKEIWNASHRHDGEDLLLVQLWWSFWIGSNILSRIVVALEARIHGQGAFAAFAFAAIISDGVDLVACILALALVIRIGESFHQNLVQQPSTGTFAQKRAADFGR